MAFKDKIKFKLSKVLLWRLLFALCLIFFLTMAGLIWSNGARETQDAFENGRRLLIALDTNEIKGKLVLLDNKPPAPATPTPETLAPVPAPVAPDEKAPTPAAPATDAKKPPPATPPGETPAAPAAPADGAAVPAPVPEEAPVVAMDENGQPVKQANLSDTAPVVPSAIALEGINPELNEKNDIGTLPIIGKDGTKPWRYYAKPFERKGSLPIIAIIVTGLGQGKGVTDSAIKLPENISLSFSPYGRDVASWVNAARIAGHEVLVDLPLEPNNYPATDPGPQGLLVNRGVQQNEQRLQWLMSRFPGYVGFLTPQNESFSSNTEAFRALLQSVNNRGLMIAIGHEPAKNDIKEMIETGSTPHVIADVLIDEELSANSIQSRLISLEKIAKTRGYAIGVAQAFPLTVEQLAAWSAKLEEQGFMLVPVTFITKLRFS